MSNINDIIININDEFGVKAQFNVHKNKNKPQGSPKALKQKENHKLVENNPNNLNKWNQNNVENTDVNTHGRPWKQLPGEVN